MSRNLLDRNTPRLNCPRTGCRAENAIIPVSPGPLTTTRQAHSCSTALLFSCSPRTSDLFVFTFVAFERNTRVPNSLFLGVFSRKQRILHRKTRFVCFRQLGIRCTAMICAIGHKTPQCKTR